VASFFVQNEGRKMNHAEVAAEKRRAADPVGEAKRQKEMAEERKEKRKAAVEDVRVKHTFWLDAFFVGGVVGGWLLGVCACVARWKMRPQCWLLRSLCPGNSLTRSLLWQDEGEKEEEDDRLSRVTLEQANKIEKKKAKKEKGKAAFGWDIFNQDSLYNAHKKRLAKVCLSQTTPGAHKRQMLPPTLHVCCCSGPSDSNPVPHPHPQKLGYSLVPPSRTFQKLGFALFLPLPALSFCPAAHRRDSLHRVHCR